MLSAIFNMIPYAIENLEKFIADFLGIADDVELSSAQFNPPVTSIQAIFGLPYAGPAIMTALAKVMFRECVCPFRFMEGNSLVLLYTTLRLKNQERKAAG